MGGRGCVRGVVVVEYSRSRCAPRPCPCPCPCPLVHRVYAARRLDLEYSRGGKRYNIGSRALSFCCFTFIRTVDQKEPIWSRRL
jgi:hypothetical protein